MSASTRRDLNSYDVLKEISSSTEDVAFQIALHKCDRYVLDQLITCVDSLDQVSDDLRERFWIALAETLQARPFERLHVSTYMAKTLNQKAPSNVKDAILARVSSP